MQLHLGIMKNKELAQWFRVTEKHYSNHRQEKLKELEFYAEFDVIRGGVNIKKLKREDTEYVKNGSAAYQLVYNSVDKEWDKSGLDTCSNVSSKIYRKYKDELGIAESTTYNYTCVSRTELYGVPFSEEGGKIGECFYLWCKKEGINEYGEPIISMFTPEEQEIKKKLMKKYFSTDVEKEILVAEMVESGEINKEQAYDLLCEMKNLNRAGFNAFKTELELAIGYPVIKATMKREKQELLGENLDFSE